MKSGGQTDAHRRTGQDKIDWIVTTDGTGDGTGQNGTPPERNRMEA